MGGLEDWRAGKWGLFWKYTSPRHAREYLKNWCNRTMRSRIEPLKKFVKTLRRHEELLMN